MDLLCGQYVALAMKWTEQVYILFIGIRYQGLGCLYLVKVSKHRLFIWKLKEINVIFGLVFLLLFD